MGGVAIIADLSGKGSDFARGVFNYVKALLGDVVLINIKKTVFKDGEFKVKISENIRRKKCFFIHDSNKKPCEWLAELIFVLEAIGFSSPEEVNVVFPYTRFARQDRKDEARVGVNIKAIADIVSYYVDRVLTCDLHAGQIQEYFGVPLDNLYSYPALIKYIKENYADFLENLVLVSPDMGGAKRIGSFAKRLSNLGIKAELALGHKVREKDNEIASLTIIGEVNGKNCLILDDIIDTGNTLIKTAEVLREKGAKRVIAFGTHGLFSDGSEKFKVFDKILVSDSLFVEKFENLEVISLITLFGEAIYRNVVGESLSILFN